MQGVVAHMAPAYAWRGFRPSPGLIQNPGSPLKLSRSGNAKHMLEWHVASDNVLEGHDSAHAAILPAEDELMTTVLAGGGILPPCGCLPSIGNDT